MTELAISEGKGLDAAQKSEDLSNYKPKPDLLADKTEDDQEVNFTIHYPPTLVKKYVAYSLH